MSLNKRMLIVFTAVLVFLASALYVTAERILMAGFKQVEDTAMSSNMQRAVNAIGDEITTLDTMVSDWANWDDTYYYVTKGRKEYERANFRNSSYTSIDMNVIMVTDRAGKILFGKAVDTHTGKIMSVPPNEWKSIVARFRSNGNNPDISLTGITQFMGLPMMISVKPILTTDRGGPSAGSFLMGRFFCKHTITRISKTTRLNLSYYSLSSRNLPYDIRRFADSKNKIEVITQSENKIAGYALVKSITDSPRLVLKAVKTRDIYKQGKRSLRYLLISSLTVGIAFIIVSLTILNYSVMRPMTTLISDIIEAGEKDDPTSRLPARGGDLGAVASSINQLLETLEKSQAELRNSEAKYRAVVEDQTEIIMRVNPGGKLVFANEACSKFLNKPLDEILGTNFVPNIKEEELLQIVMTILNATSENPVLEFENQITLDGGEQRWLHMTIRGIFDSSGAPTDYQVVARDVTERKLAEEALIRSHKETTIAQLYLGLSHEIKNPLAIIQAHVETLLENETLMAVSDDKIGYSLSVIAKQTERILGVLMSLSNIVKDTGIAFSEIDLTSHIESLIDMFGPSFKKSRILVNKDFPATPVTIEAETGRLTQVIMNLMLNARDAMPDGGTITVSISMDHGEAVISISDTGRGISKENLKKVFEPFFSLSPRGMGMGLPICRRFVEDHRGSITVESIEGEGTKVIVRLPLKQGKKTG